MTTPTQITQLKKQLEDLTTRSGGDEPITDVNLFMQIGAVLYDISIAVEKALDTAYNNVKNEILDKGPNYPFKPALLNALEGIEAISDLSAYTRDFAIMESGQIPPDWATPVTVNRLNRYGQLLLKRVDAANAYIKAVPIPSIETALWGSGLGPLPAVVNELLDMLKMVYGAVKSTVQNLGTVVSLVPFALGIAGVYVLMKWAQSVTPPEGARVRPKWLS